MDHKEVSRQFEPFFQVWYPHLLRYVCRFAPCRATAEDVVQDVFLDLYKALGAGQTIEFPKAWTLRVARRKCADLRSRPFDLDQSHESLEVLEALGNGGEHPAAALDSNLDIERLRGCLSVLTDREEQVLLLRLEAMKFREIASSLGITTSSVNTLLVRALDRLQRAFGVREARTPARRRHEI
jgi:RNA polymerase sigma factor (sigma-70 family)